VRFIFAKSDLFRPGDGRIWACLASAYRKLGMSRDALAAAKRAVSSEPDYLDPNMLSLIGRLLKEQADTANSKQRKSDYLPSLVLAQNKKRLSLNPAEIAELRENSRIWYERAWEQRNPSLGSSLALSGEALVDTVESLVHSCLSQLNDESSIQEIQTQITQCSDFISEALLSSETTYHDRLQSLQREVRETALNKHGLDESMGIISSQPGPYRRSPGTTTVEGREDTLVLPTSDASGTAGNTGNLSMVSMDMDDSFQ
jgi:hypothetical protein